MIGYQEEAMGFIASLVSLIAFAALLYIARGRRGEALPILQRSWLLESGQRGEAAELVRR